MEKSIVKHRAAAAIKDSSPSRSHNATRSKSQKDSIKDLKHAAVACVICADDNIRFAAIGSCDHPICSLCSMRIRVKTLEKGCPLCKQLMETVIVFSVKVNGLLPYSSFGVWGLDSPATGLEIDHRAGMIFADCKDHFKEMDKIRSLVCPLKKCNLRFSSDEALLKHMCAAHAGQNLCVLCLKNRPLFISEHKVMTNADLKKHMCAPPGALTGAGGDKTAGHPLCLFCNEHFFDSHALYLHMKREHQSCHLCPTSYQFRFYPSIDELRVHLHTEHFVCNICEKASLNGVEGPGVFGSSFRHHGEYSSHLLSMHGIKNHSMTLGFQIGYEGDGRIRERESGRGKGRKASNQLSFLDLDMTSADPNRTSSSQASNRQQGQSNGGGRGHVRDANSEAVSVNESMNDAATSESRRRQLFHLQTSAAIAAAPLVPPHMRVAGRVVAGRFQRDADDDNLQAAADEQALIAAAGGSRAPFSGGPDGGWSGRAINSMNMNRAFPALSAASSSTKEGEMEEKRDTSGRHPMSLVSVIQRDAAAKRAIEEEKRVKMAEVENRRLRRNEMMADGLGLNNVPASATDASATLDPSELRRPLFPPTLLTWAKNNKVELQKLEKKMVDLINDKGSNSSQLKAMGPSSRNAVHGLSKYYFLNSYEYDPEPRRYISLVKSARSSMPSVLLSAASSMPPLAPANILSAMNLPILYVSLANPSNGFAPTDTVSEGRSRKKAGEDALTLAMDGNITVGDVVSRVKAVLKSLIVQHHPYSLPNSHRILLVKAGATSVRVDYRSI